MQQQQPVVSATFKKMAVRTILSILFFILVYILLVIGAIGLTILCGYIGFMLIVAKPAIITLLLGIGIISMGFLVLAFLVKFLFAKHKVDRSGLIEITRTSQPKLFAMITDIVSQVQTTFPKKVYLSGDVNASVFYDSSFWSMFFPVRKNLQIGLGLVNSVSALELKAILAHEFGHFSQRSMKVGSYVYNVNQVIYNMLFENEGYGSAAQRWASASGYFAIFVSLAVYIVRGIQAILKGAYQVVNLNYLSLSREMEFHADAVAAKVAGGAALKSSLLRLDLANHAYHSVVQFYQNEQGKLKTQNIYPQHSYLMQFLAKENDIAIEDNLPQVSIDHMNRYISSKLVIKDQWASHPSTKDRVKMLDATNGHLVTDDYQPAAVLFTGMEEMQAKMTQLALPNGQAKEPAEINTDGFIEKYSTNIQNNSFPPFYNGYYDNKHLGDIDIDSVDTTSADGIASETLFSPEMVQLVESVTVLENDLEAINKIAAREIKIKTFDYDGTKYRWHDAKDLIQSLEKKIAMIRESIQENDIAIFRFFCLQARLRGKEEEYKNRFRALKKLEHESAEGFELYDRMVKSVGFMRQKLSEAGIVRNVEELKNVEKDFKVRILEMLSLEQYNDVLTPEIKELFTKYTSESWTYFAQGRYFENDLNLLFGSIHYFPYVINKAHFLRKREFLIFQAGLISETEGAHLERSTSIQ